MGGGFKFIRTVAELEDELDINRYIAMGGGNISLKIKFDEGKALISTLIRSDENKTIVKIVDNHWVVNNDPLIAYDRNYNDFAFEVIDSDQIPRLQVLIRENNVIYIGGYFDVPIGKVLAMPHTSIINPSQESVEKFKEMRLFKYPSEDHLGEIITPLPDYEF